MWCGPGSPAGWPPATRLAIDVMSASVVVAPSEGDDPGDDQQHRQDESPQQPAHGSHLSVGSEHGAASDAAARSRQPAPAGLPRPHPAGTTRSGRGREGARAAEQHGQEQRAGGSRVETVFPDAAAGDVFDANAVDPSTRGQAARGGYAQGGDLAESLAAFWG